MTNEETLVQMDVQVSEARKMIAVRDAYLKLVKSKPFKDVIEQAYFKEEAARLVMAKANRSLDEDTQNHIDKQIVGVGSLANYFEGVMQRGWQAQNDIEQIEKAREEILAEEIS